MEEVFFFFFIYICRITEFTVVPNTKHGLQSREPRACTEHPQLQRGFLTWWSGRSPPSTAALQLAYTFPTRLHFSHSLAAKIGKFLYLVPGEVLITTPMSYIYLSLQPHIQHQLHALRAQNHTEARTLQWHRIGFATDYSCRTSYHTWVRVIINQNLSWLTKLVSWHFTHEFKATRAYTRKK